ncbi:STAS domain-containing protein [Rossellomorea vietnamensis]|uniref:STAS domain-containing protein n=1 Tax=Rossellomorea vietnamensis TaxID=218284 RepID=A0ACD4CCM7_9BACI|nr:STAS domain-containing protein [Rossellomorea vietnamensis]UXH46370.1 STAS domain-containing protein [Rossellomorea vietnamensis]
MIDQGRQTYTKAICEKVLSQKQELIVEKDNLRSSEYRNIESKLHSWREDIIDIYAKSIESDLDTAFEKLKEWGSEAVDTLVNFNLPLEVALDEVRDYRNLIGQIMKEEASKFDMSFDQFYDLISDFDAVVDRAIYWLTMSYSRRFYTRINAAEATALELSIPVIKITKQVGVLPLIGDIDTERAQELMDKALSKGNDLSLEYMVIDLSGVPIIDTMVADRIFKVVDALSLIGIETILSGIRPEIAQTMTHLGIDSSNIAVTSSLHIALEKFLQA